MRTSESGWATAVQLCLDGGCRWPDATRSHRLCGVLIGGRPASLGWEEDID